jgi:hypothetical protein
VLNPDDLETRFEIEQDEALAIGNVISQGSIAYKATSILGPFEGVVVAEWIGGPAQFGRENSPT